MCKHAENTADLINTFLEDLYPELTNEIYFVNQALLVDGGKHYSQQIHEIFAGIKNEFNSLKAYEIKLVFPAVLKAFDKKKSNRHNEDKSPNIAELQKLTNVKVQRLLALTDELNKIVSESNYAKKHQEFERINSIFNVRFFECRKRWNAMLDERLQTCACFKTSLLPHKINTPHDGS